MTEQERRIRELEEKVRALQETLSKLCDMYSSHSHETDNYDISVGEPIDPSTKRPEYICFSP